MDNGDGIRDVLDYQFGEFVKMVLMRWMKRRGEKTCGWWRKRMVMIWIVFILERRSMKGRQLYLRYVNSYCDDFEDVGTDCLIVFKFIAITLFHSWFYIHVCLQVLTSGLYYYSSLPLYTWYMADIWLSCNFV